jgi:hypothetical protein
MELFVGLVQTIHPKLMWHHSHLLHLKVSK